MIGCKYCCWVKKEYICCNGCDLFDTCSSRCEEESHKNCKSIITLIKEDKKVKAKISRRVVEEIEIKGGMVFSVNGEQMVLLERVNEASSKTFYSLVNLKSAETIMFTSDLKMIVKFLEQEVAVSEGELKDWIMPF